jgi:6-phospho-beta-glucosidase
VKVAIVGGGGFRVPLVHGALLHGAGDEVTEVALHDVDERRLGVIADVLDQQAEGWTTRPTVRATTDLEAALEGADAVLVAVRVGGLRGRTVDERVALDLGVLGQETTGPGGIAYGLRTVPVAVEIAERVAAAAPGTWVVNLTNPAGVVTRAMQSVLGDRVVGVCDSPTGLVRRVAMALGLAPEDVEPGYVGLNHLGWLRSLWHDGHDRLPELLSRPDLLVTFEEGRLFGPERIAALRAIPNEYLYYVDHAADLVRAMRSAPETRGEYLRAQQERFYTEAIARPGEAFRIWRRARAERDATYLSEARTPDEERDATDVELGGYEEIALMVLRGLWGAVTGPVVLGVRNAGAVPGCAADDVVEVPTHVNVSGVHPVPQPALTGEPLRLMDRVRDVERLVVAAGRTRSRELALEAFATHPLVPDRGTAEALLTAYAREHKELSDLA